MFNTDQPRQLPVVGTNTCTAHIASQANFNRELAREDISFAHAPDVQRQSDKEALRQTYRLRESHKRARTFRRHLCMPVIQALSFSARRKEDMRQLQTPKGGAERVMDIFAEKHRHRRKSKEGHAEGNNSRTNTLVDTKRHPLHFHYRSD
mmetsp:Transcript_33386/g.66201  ORF Transcript_33386/g.66201 Transcript_33386/m.66201 type:complete len:150 (+) Transcript_33386:99-548(+)